MDNSIKIPKHVTDMLEQGESVEETFRQQQLGMDGSLVSPTLVICTNLRLILVHGRALGLRKEYEIIPYRQITSVRHDHGIFSSSVFLDTKGYHKAHGLVNEEEGEGEIKGLTNKDADSLVEYLNVKISYTKEEQNARKEAEEHGGHVHPNAVGAYIYCANCGHKNSTGAKLCVECGSRLAP